MPPRESLCTALASGTITIPDPSPCAPPSCGAGVPDGADIIDGFLYWTTIETSASPSGNTGTFLGYSITGEQIGSDVPNYSDGTYSGTLRVYRADVNNYFQVPANWNGARQGSGPFTVTLPNSNGTITEGASLVVIWRVLSPNFPLKSVVLYNGSIAPTSATGPIPQAVQGFYDAAGGANGTGEVTHLYTSGGSWNDSESPQTLGQSNQYIDTLTTGNAYAAVILSTPVNNSDNDGILDAWKAAQGYTDVKTGTWVPLPGATHGEQDLFVQFDYMCSALNADNTCDFTQPNLYPSPDAQGNDPLAMVTQAFANYGVHLHLKPGNAIQESTCTDIVRNADSASSPTSRGWSPGMAASSSQRYGQSIIPPARRTRRKPLARPVSPMVRRTAITTFCSVTLLRSRPGPPALDPLLQSPPRAAPAGAPGPGPSLPQASALLAQPESRFPACREIPTSTRSTMA